MTRLFDTHAWLWDEALTALERAENRQRRFFALLGAHTCEPVWEPPVDVFETDSEVRVVVALPGVPADRVTLNVGPTEIVVQTVRPSRPGIESMRIQRLEIPYGTFERRIELPGRCTLAEQRMADGCLELRLTKE